MSGIVIAVAVVAAGGAAIYVGSKVKRQVEKAKDFYHQIQKVTDDTMYTPRTLSGSEGLMLTRIVKDFPEFNKDVTRQIVRGTLSTYFAILNERSGTHRLDKTCTDALIHEVEGIAVNESAQYYDIQIHKVVISDYRKNGEEAVITWQAAVGYRRNEKAMAQYVYEIKYVYYLAENNDGENVSLICKHCGAEISTLGEKVCEYCGAEINASVERTWKINKIYKAR
jgi:hypothetical protein